MPKKLTQQEFLDKAQAVHGPKYDYSQSIYINAATKIKLICSVHGSFEQLATTHLRGGGCLKCANGLLVSTSEFIIRAKEIHGNRYDYSDTTYLGMDRKATINCLIHGPFAQTPGNHLLGRGCKKCNVLGARPLTTEQFIQKARAVHGDKYDYSCTVYASVSAKLLISCFYHGIFSQRANTHLNGCGCPDCGVENRARAERQDWLSKAKGRNARLYFLRVYSDTESFYKVGITLTTVEKRYKNKDSLAGYQYEILAQHISANASGVYDWEKSIIESFQHLSYAPKMKFAGSSECFSSADEILAIFPL